MDDKDTEWLLTRLPAKDTLGTATNKGLALLNLIESLRRADMPVTVGLFGSWGSGKTTTLAWVANNLRRAKDHEVIYFNAWKYSSFADVVPALIYKVLSFAITDNKTSNLAVLGKVMLGLGKKYADDLGSWSKSHLGLNLAEVAKDAYEIRGLVQNAAANSGALLAQEYYTQIDKSQDLLAKACRESPKIIVTLIDELDRCDPGEAFEIIKQLRVFFTMSKVPLVFVLSVNPDPIGQAIKHQFGLESDWGDYEARKILEKFTDYYLDMEDNSPIVSYVRDLWTSSKLNLDDSCFIARADSVIKRPVYIEDTVKNASFDECILANNPIYANRRLLNKCLQRVLRGERTQVAWTAWHLEIAEQAYPSLRKSMSLLAEDLGAISENAHIQLIRLLAESKCLNLKTGDLLESRLDSTKGKTAFASYRSLFWECYREQIEALENLSDNEKKLRNKELRGIIDDPRKMDFLATALMQPLPGLLIGNEVKKEGAIKGWESMFNRDHLEYVLF